jgi:hypothetical protein
MEILQKSFQKLSNQVVDLKKAAEEGSSHKGFYQTPYRRPPQNPPNRKTLPAKGMSLEGLDNAIQVLLYGFDNNFYVTVE